MNAFGRYVKYMATGMYSSFIGRASWLESNRCDITGAEIESGNRCFILQCESRQTYRGMRSRLVFGKAAYSEVLEGIISSRMYGKIGLSLPGLYVQEGETIRTAIGSVYSYSLVSHPGIADTKNMKCILCGTEMIEKFASSRTSWGDDICPRCFFQSVALCMYIYADQFDAYPR